MNNNNENTDEVKRYLNADWANLSPEQVEEMFDVPKPLNDNFIDNLEWALMYLNADKIGHPLHYEETKECFFNINTFDGAWLLDVAKLGCDEKDDIKIFNPLTDLQATLDMFDSFNLKTFNLGDNKDSIPFLKKIRKMDSPEIRHLKVNKFKYVLECREAVISKKEKWYTKGWYRGTMNHHFKDVKQECTIPIPITYNPNYYIKYSDIAAYIKTDDFLNEVKELNLLLNMKLTAYYEWFIYIKEDDKSLGIKIPILPESSKEIFALRDLPEGDKRKKAIVNFIKEHYRTIKNKYNEDVRETLIKQHLRGETKFNWRGLQVNVIPAEYDLKRIKTRKKFVNI